MKRISICDITMPQEAAHRDKFTLTFKEKIEVSSLLDGMGVDVIELEGLGEEKADILRLKAIAAAVNRAVIAVPVLPDKARIDRTWNVIKDFPRKRMVLKLPVSTVGMEYGYRLKEGPMLSLIKENLEYIAGLTDDFEFVAMDATRAEKAFLYRVIETAVELGAKTVSVYDEAGTFLPGDMKRFVDGICENVPDIKKATLGVGSANRIAMGGAALIEAVKHGAGEIKAAAFSVDTVFLNDLAKTIFEKSEVLGVETGLNRMEMDQTIGRIRWICKTGKSVTSAFDNAVSKESPEEPQEQANEEDIPEIYKIDSYTINTGSVMTSTAHIRLCREGKMLEEVVMGDGPIDASFLAIERITGRHFELEDFQIKAISEGREALGQALVRLRGNEGLYTGIGRSTDIIGACIIAYVNALNKIAYKEQVL